MRKGQCVSGCHKTGLHTIHFPKGLTPFLLGLLDRPDSFLGPVLWSPPLSYCLASTVWENIAAVFLVSDADLSVFPAIPLHFLVNQL